MNSDTPPSKTSIIFGGEVFDGRDSAHPRVIDRDGIAHDVRVRAMPARHLGRVLEVCTDEALLLEVVCSVAYRPEGLPSDWVPVDANFVDNLSDESHVLLVEAAKRQNFSRAASWGERQIAAKQWQAPLLLKADEALKPVVEKMAALLLSSLRSSGSLAAPATKS